jgi:hypothetical protein
MFLDKMGKGEYVFDIKIGNSRLKIPIQVILLIICGGLALGLLKAARQL